MMTARGKYGRDGLYLLLRLSGSVVALGSTMLLPLFGGEHAIQLLSRYAAAAGWDGVATALIVTDARLVEAGAVLAPWISATLLLCVLLVLAVDGRFKHGLASTAALLLGTMAYCPPIQPLAWLLLTTVFVVPTVFVIRARGFSNLLGTVRSAASALALAVLWVVAWPALVRRARGAGSAAGMAHEPSSRRSSASRGEMPARTASSHTRS